jgi:tRNA modification GTPase
MYPLDDTIAAIASAPGGAARGIVRLSGPNVLHCLRAIFHSSDKSEIQVPTHPRAIEGSLDLVDIGSPVPCDLFLWPDGRSYTGQMAAEFHTPGSPPLLDALLKSLCTAGARMAEPGEFTLRAFLSGRIDLTQAEAVLGVIDAADPREFQVAVAQLAGGLAGPLHNLRDMLLELLAHLEAGFDFADEDLPFITADELFNRLEQAVDKVARLADQMELRGVVQTSIRAVLLGQPNTGKSSLFNALTRKEHALVSDLPGTTRDYLVAELDFDGRKCQLIDTAGLHPKPVSLPPKAPDQSAQEAAAEQISRAHVRLFCLDATRPLDPWEQAELTNCVNLHQIVVWTKIDAVSPEANSAGLRRPLAESVSVLTSSLTGEGIDELRAELRRMVNGVDISSGDVVASTAVRCHESLRHAGEFLENALNLARTRGGEEFIAAEIRLALEELGKVVGAVYTDDVLDRIFSRFCVGK